ncbi:MAG: pyridoxamine 5'-phosphate oxidase family protein [Gammaproteobacteria bacterium]|jgi:nitroimidazol reductase NimA-like FMN-containing flavoprotein (pyridoxamine 5'-phosphate oxidase superfamily)|nr:pyridoxamine 5'-phosphate oxidase family protein [Gammaproteobacteria bacterium]
MGNLKKTVRSSVKRMKERGIYEREQVNDILDAGFVCHVAYNIDGLPYCTPTMYWRSGDHVYWHGSSVSRFLKQVLDQQVCLTVTHVDGFVLARSAFNHSMNYRSVMLFGQAEEVTGPEKLEQLRVMVEHLFPGRWDELRPVTRKELNATTVLRMLMEEGSAKVREGDPSDNKEDYKLPIWAGVIPLGLSAGGLVSDPANLPGVLVPDHLQSFVLPGERD